MKYRNGLVSNSSSSSFIVYGCELSTLEIDNLAKRLGMDKSFIEDLEDLCLYEKAERFESELNKIPAFSSVEVRDLDDEIYLGSINNAESISPQQMATGIVSKSEMEAIDKLLEMIGESASVHHVEYYS